MRACAGFQAQLCLEGRDPALLRWAQVRSQDLLWCWPGLEDLAASNLQSVNDSVKIEIHGRIESADPPSLVLTIFIRCRVSSSNAGSHLEWVRRIALLPIAVPSCGCPPLVLVCLCRVRRSARLASRVRLEACIGATAWCLAAALESRSRFSGARIAAAPCNRQWFQKRKQAVVPKTNFQPSSLPSGRKGIAHSLMQRAAWG